MTSTSPLNQITTRQLDTSKLQIGSTVKNYKELCSLLGEKVKKGDSKKAQLKEWSRYFEFERIKYSQSFLILDIYDEPLDNNDGRSRGNNSVYAKYIETILINYLSKQEGNTKTFTRRNWWNLLGMINEKYGRISTNQLNKINKCFTDFEINHFYQRSNRKLDRILISALTNLKNRRLIEWEYQTVIMKDGQYFVANDKEVEHILAAENYVLNKIYKCDDIRQIYISYQQKDYYQQVYNILFEKYGYSEYFKRIKIIYNQENMIDALPRTELQLQKLLLNNEISDYLNNEAEKINNNWIEKYKNGKTEIFPYIYLKAQQLLVDELIRPVNSIEIKQFLDKADQEELDSIFMC